MERSKKKGFLAPLKGKEDPKQRIDEDAEQKKSAKSVPFKNQKESSPEQNNGAPKIIFQRKKVKDGQRTLKKPQDPKETVSAIPPKSLTDSEYDDIFKAVLQEAMNADCDDKATRDKSKESATFSKSEYNEKVANKCIDEKDDLDSLKSEDVDIWTDSPPPTINQKNENGLCPLKSKCSVQKKAERNGSLKPKQLIFSNSESTTEKKENKQEVVRNKDMARNHTSQIKKKDEKDEKRANAICGSVLFKKEGAAKQEKGQPGLEDKVKNRKKVKQVEMNNGQNKEEAVHEQEEETGTWIQCSNKLCGKWRYVATIEDPVLVPSLWECKMNSDKKHNSCDIPEVNYDESKHICTSFTIGSLVWAKMDGFPWWPGMIEPDPDYDTYFELRTEKSMVPFQYHVTFFDDHVTRAWIRTNFIIPYSKGYEPAKKVSKVCNSYRKEIEQAVANADRAMALSLVERINTYGFSKRYRNNKKSKWRLKEYRAAPSKKAKKKGRREIKDNIIRCMQLETQPLKDHDTDDSLDDFSEDSEYIPVKTKSRGLKNCNSLDERTETQDSKVKEGSSSEDEYDNQSKSSKSEDSSDEVADCKLPTETKFDPDVFTMEIDSVPVNHHPRNNNSDKLGEILCDTVERHTDINRSDTEHTSKNSVADMSIDYSHSKDVFKDSTNSEDMSLGKMEIAFTNDKDASDNCEEITKKKKKGKKLALKSKALSTNGKEECREAGDEEEEKHDAPNMQKDAEINTNFKTKVSTNYENGASTKKNKKKSSKQEKSERCDVACVGGNNDRPNEGESKMEGIHDRISSNQFHGKGSFQGIEKEHPNLSKNLGAKDENATNITGKCIEDTRMPTEAEKENMSGEVSLENEKAIMRKNKTRERKKIKSEDDSDKENIEPSKEINQTKKANDEQRPYKKGLKRQAASSTNSLIPALKKQEKDVTNETKQPKMLIKLEVPCIDQYVETKQNGNSKKEESDEEKQSGMKVNKRKCKAFNEIGKDLGKDEEQKRKDKVNKKKLKSFAAPVKVCKSLDREVPQISSPNKGSNKDKNSLKSKTADCSLINDQHMVPDVTMGMESNIDSYLDIDTGYDENAGTKSFKLKEKMSDIRDNAKDRINDNNVSAKEDEDVLDLDIDIQNDLNEPKNYVNSSEESDSAEMEQSNFESVPHKQNVIVEEIKDLPPIFGRFAGRCAEHGSDSDPMELIED